jgi:hypothetical protein
MRNLLAAAALTLALQSLSAEAWPGCPSCDLSSNRAGPPGGVKFAKNGGMGGGMRPSGGGMGSGCGGMGCQGGGGMGNGSGGGMGGGGMGGGWINHSGGWTSLLGGGTAKCPPKSSQRPKHRAKPIPPPGPCDTGF